MLTCYECKKKGYHQQQVLHTHDRGPVWRHLASPCTHGSVSCGHSLYLSCSTAHSYFRKPTWRNNRKSSQTPLATAQLNLHLVASYIPVFWIKELSMNAPAYVFWPRCRPLPWHFYLIVFILEWSMGFLAWFPAQITQTTWVWLLQYASLQP